MKEEIKTKKVYIRTYGCQMNDRDSEIIKGMLIGRGFAFTPRVEEADVILFNTCSVRAHAEERVWGKLGMLKGLKEERPGVIFGVLGCMAQNYKEAIFKKAPYVDLVCGTGNIYELPDLLKKLLNDREKFMHRSLNIKRDCFTQPVPSEIASLSLAMTSAGSTMAKVESVIARSIATKQSNLIAVDRTERPNITGGTVNYREGSIQAYVTIMEGCDNLCSYCIVPYVRGREKSRHPEDILSEIRDLAQRGFKEVTLLGQNVNSYGRGFNADIDFTCLLKMVNEVEGIERVRFVTNHPKDASVKLFQVMAELPKVCEHIHLPVQSGSDKILKAMNRGYEAEDYKRLVESLRKWVPGCSITTDIIIGFPGEDERDFQDTYKLMKDIEFDSAFIFKYSPRKGSGAWGFKDDVPREVKEERNQILLGLQDKITLEKNGRLIGETVEVLVEKKGRNKGGGDYPVWKGRSRTNKKVVFYDGDEDLYGELVEAKITGVEKETLLGVGNVV